MRDRGRVCTGRDESRNNITSLLEDDGDLDGLDDALAEDRGVFARRVQVARRFGKGLGVVLIGDGARGATVEDIVY